MESALMGVHSWSQPFSVLLLFLLYFPLELISFSIPLLFSSSAHLFLRQGAAISQLFHEMI